MDELERVQSRLENIRAVEPILSAMRTISLASWQMALNRRAHLRRYTEALNRALAAMPPRLHASRFASRALPATGPSTAVALVVGSERGLCGRFNAATVERAEKYLAEAARDDRDVALMALGTRVTRTLQQRGHILDWSGKLSLTALPSYRQALDLTRRWLRDYEANEIVTVDVIYNDYRGIGYYQTRVARLLPPHADQGFVGVAQEPPWPPVIVETDPVSLCNRGVEQWIASRLCEMLTASTAAEHSVRYQLMEGATRNAERLIRELTMTIQTARQQAITEEMQELAAGAGLIGPRQRPAGPS